MPAPAGVDRPGWAPFVCPTCRQSLGAASGSTVSCGRGHTFSVAAGIPRFVSDARHESFGIQWNEFADVQLDSVNGTDESRSRLLTQSRRPPAFWNGKLVLEAGCGAGRFTEVLLGWGAIVVAVDYSRAVDACARNNVQALAERQLHVAQADILNLPVRPLSFDVVLCYGVLQHTGDPRRALVSVWECVRSGGVLMVDRYQTSVRRVAPFKYLGRPLTRRLDPASLLRVSQAFVARVAPTERSVIRWTARGGRLRRAIAVAVHRAPNSVYPFELERRGQLDSETAMRWSVLDTFDQFAPRYDRPCTLHQWRSQLEGLVGGRVDGAFACGQGNAGIVLRA